MVPPTTWGEEGFSLGEAAGLAASGPGVGTARWPPDRLLLGQLPWPRLEPLRLVLRLDELAEEP